MRRRREKGMEAGTGWKRERKRERCQALINTLVADNQFNIQPHLSTLSQKLVQAK